MGFTFPAAVRERKRSSTIENSGRFAHARAGIRELELPGPGLRSSSPPMFLGEDLRQESNSTYHFERGGWARAERQVGLN